MGALLTGIAGVALAGGLIAPLAGDGVAPSPPWRFVGLPKQAMPRTDFRIGVADGARALRIESNASYGNLVHPVPAGTIGHRLAWRWRIDEPLPSADLRQRNGDDTVAKVCVLFDLPMQAVPFMERQLLRLARSLSSEPLPAATVCYVWDARLSAGTAVPNAFTGRMRYLVLRGPEAPLHAWVSEQRDVAADFLRLFGDEASRVPPLLGVAVGADADNTQGHGLAWVDTLQLD